MKRAGSAARTVVNLLGTVLILGATSGFVPARSQSVAAQTDAGRQVAGLLGDASGAERYRILHNLNATNRIASGLSVADLNSIIAGMEDQRAKVISLMARKLQPNLTAADVVALSGDTSGSTRYNILHNLNAANRIASGLTVADLNAIIVGMEDQRAKVISLLARKLQPNLTAADVVALSGDTRGSTRYTILHNLNAANRIASGLSVADLNAIIVGMEDQRAKVISLMARKLQPNLSAADVVASGGSGPSTVVNENQRYDSVSRYYQQLRAGDVPTWKSLLDVVSLFKGVTGYDEIADPLLRSRLRQKAGGNWVYSAVVEAFIDIVVGELDRNGAFGPACPFGNFCDRYVMKSYLITMKNMTLLNIPAQIWDQGWLIAESWQQTKEAFDELPCFNSLSAMDQAELVDLYRIKRLIGSPEQQGCQGSW